MRDELDVMSNNRRGEDGTMIETINPNTPSVKQLLCEELENTRDSAGVEEETLLTMIASGQDITAAQAIERLGES